MLLLSLSRRRSLPQILSFPPQFETGPAGLTTKASVRAPNSPNQQVPMLDLDAITYVTPVLITHLKKTAGFFRGFGLFLGPRYQHRRSFAWAAFEWRLGSSLSHR